MSPFITILGFTFISIASWAGSQSSTVWVVYDGFIEVDTWPRVAWSMDKRRINSIFIIPVKYYIVYSVNLACTK